MRYEQIMETHGRPLSDIGVSEMALDRQFALVAVDALRTEGRPILGGDVYRVVGGKPVPSYDNWFCEKQAVEGIEAFVQRSCDVAERFVRTYPTAEQSLFTLVI